MTASPVLRGPGPEHHWSSANDRRAIRRPNHHRYLRPATEQARVRADHPRRLARRPHPRPAENYRAPGAAARRSSRPDQDAEELAVGRTPSHSLLPALTDAVTSWRG